jgi:hypothetical protein
VIGGENWYLEVWTNERDVLENNNNVCNIVPVEIWNPLKRFILNKRKYYGNLVDIDIVVRV